MAGLPADHAVERGHLVGEFFEDGCSQVFGSAVVLVEGDKLDDVPFGRRFGTF